MNEVSQKPNSDTIFLKLEIGNCFSSKFCSKLILLSVIVLGHV